MWSQFFIKHIKHIGDGQILGAVNCRFEIAPEMRQKRFPIKCACRNFIKLRLKLGGEIILNIAVKEIAQKG